MPYIFDSARAFSWSPVTMAVITELPVCSTPGMKSSWAIQPAPTTA